MSASRLVDRLPRRRSALLCPKPKGALQAARDYQYGHLKGGPKRQPLDQRALRFIAEHGDLIVTPIRPALDLTAAQPAEGWLLVPAPHWLLTHLAMLDAEHEDIEPDEDREDDHDREGMVGTEWSPGCPTPQLVEDDDREEDAIREEDYLIVTAEQRGRHDRSTYRSTDSAEKARCEAFIRRLRGKR